MLVNCDGFLEFWDAPGGSRKKITEKK